MQPVPSPAQPEEIARRLAALVDEARLLTQSLNEAAQHLGNLADIGSSLEEIDRDPRL